MERPSLRISAGTYPINPSRAERIRPCAVPGRRLLRRCRRLNQENQTRTGQSWKRCAKPFISSNFARPNADSKSALDALTSPSHRWTDRKTLC
jgi:hypothetical protein